MNAMLGWAGLVSCCRSSQSKCVPTKVVITTNSVHCNLSVACVAVIVSPPVAAGNYERAVSRHGV